MKKKSNDIMNSMTDKGVAETRLQNLFSIYYHFSALALVFCLTTI